MMDNMFKATGSIKNPFTILLPFAIIGYITACTKADINFGSQYIDNEYTRIISIDTFAPQLSTLYIDSFLTGASGRGVAGVYKDPQFGLVTAKSYFQLQPPDYVTNTDYTGTTVDSFVLVLKPDGTYYGDTAKNLTLRIFQLKDDIAAIGNNTEFYNVDTIAVNTLLGEKTFAYTPHNTSDISIRLDDDMGEQLLQLYRQKSTYVQSSNEFIKYFKGISIQAAGNDSYVFGVKDSIKMRIFYKERSATPKDSTIDFTLNNISHQFNNITINRSGTALSGISSQNKLISSSITGDAGYLQSITGTVVKVSFPSIRNLLKIPGYTKLARALLVIRPVAGSFNGLYYLPDSLRLSQTDLNNKIGTDLTDNTSDLRVLYGNLNIDDLYGQNTYYTYDITGYISTELGISLNNQDGLIISPPTPGFDSKFYRAVIGDVNNKQSKIQLLLYYISVQ